MMGDSIRRRSGRGRGKGARPGTRTGARSGTGVPALDYRRWAMWVGGGAVFAFLLGWLIATQILFPRPALARDEVAVPNLTGLSVEEAREQLSDARLELGRVREMVHPDARRGGVIAQDPVSGQRLRPGAQVSVAVSQGRPRVTVPELTGMPIDAALALAERIGFETEQVEEATVEEAGRVLRTNPAAGQSADLPATLVIVVSAGGLAAPEAAPRAIDSAEGEPARDASGKILRNEERTDR